MAKNIIICCDGTGNQFGNSNSNVVKLYSVVEKIADEQIAYYDPGVGTNRTPGLGLSIKNFIRKVRGLATGYGLYENVYQAYAYLMENYEEGDKVYLFGFSRGAYTVRVLSGFMHALGLLEKGCQNLIPYAFAMYSVKNIDFAKTAKFKFQFSRKCAVHFMGIWDTVSSIGYFGNWKSYPYTANNKSVKIIRHALAIDERRAFYTQNKIGYNQAEHQDIKEVWFAGVHSDVGGSYPEMESGLSKIALQWMVGEAEQAGLEINKERFQAKVMTDSKNTVGPNPHGILHKSLTGFWRLLEIIPKSKIIDYKTRKKKRYIPLGRYRSIPEDAFIHETVFERMKAGNYAPPNIPEKHRIEKIKAVLQD